MSLDAAGVNTLHEQRDDLGLATEMQVLGRGSPAASKTREYAIVWPRSSAPYRIMKSIAVSTSLTVTSRYWFTPSTYAQAPASETSSIGLVFGQSPHSHAAYRAYSARVSRSAASSSCRVVLGCCCLPASAGLGCSSAGCMRAPCRTSAVSNALAAALERGAGQ
jgi:hypothetical protein